MVSVLGIACLIGALDLAATRLYIGRMRRLALENPATTAYMERAARNGTGPREWTWTPLDSVPALAACAVVFSEDRRFFKIGTLDYASQREMLGRMLRGDFSRGGSGIVQQLARNLYLGPQRTPRRKAREYLLAWQLSHTISKDRQLEIYLNVVEWGKGVWGIGAASRHYFGVAPDDLTPSQALMLAQLLPAPRRGLRFTASERVGERMGYVLSLLRGAMVLDDLAAQSTEERLRHLGRRIREGMTPGEASVSVDSLMGPEAIARPLSDAEGAPLRRTCNFWRRS